MDITKNELRQIICDVLDIKETTITIERQINNFVLGSGYSYKDIARALVFFVEIEKGDVEPKYGIGIVPHVIDRSRAFFENKKKERKRQVESIKEAEKIPDILLRAGRIRRKRKLPKIDIEKIEID